MTNLGYFAPSPRVGGEALVGVDGVIVPGAAKAVARIEEEAGAGVEGSLMPCHGEAGTPNRV